MTADLPTTDESNQSLEAYEVLRAHVLTPSSAGSPSGLLVLLKQGVAAWSAHRDSLPPSPPSRSPSPPATAPPANELHAGVVRVLASIAIATREALRA